jgi:pimeloyl-ACP methyl ester carboxylesterase
MHNPRWLATAIAGTVVALASVSPAAAAPLPITYGAPYAYLVGGSQLTASPPGANDWSCKPTAAHPYPVVLVHQTASTAELNWIDLSPYLKNQGYCVFALTYGVDPSVSPVIGGIADLDQSAAQVAAFVNQVLAATGASKVDMVGHSQGGVISREFIQELGGANEVNTMVLLASPWAVAGGDNLGDLANLLLGEAPPVVTQAIAGVNAATLPFLQLFDDPAYWAKLNAVDYGTSPGVRYVEITSHADEISYISDYVTPPVTNASLEWVQDACPLAWPDHETIPYNATAVAMIANALDPAQAVTPPCSLSS